MRLIDADAFEKFIEEKYKYGESTDDIKDQMLFDLSYQPKAFDVEKVVAEIKSQFGCKDCEYADVSPTPYVCLGECEELEVINEICDIVKRGGAV